MPITLATTHKVPVPQVLALPRMPLPSPLHTFYLLKQLLRSPDCTLYHTCALETSLMEEAWRGIAVSDHLQECSLQHRLCQSGPEVMTEAQCGLSDTLGHAPCPQQLGYGEIRNSSLSLHPTGDSMAPAPAPG